MFQFRYRTYLICLFIQRLCFNEVRQTQRQFLRRLAAAPASYGRRTYLSTATRLSDIMAVVFISYLYDVLR